MTGMIVFAVSFLKAFITGWPLAAAMALFAIQVAR
jgi:hypothetical protein